MESDLKTEEVRARFAPSPTGALHIGGARTALFNYLFARKNKGKFILRIEDTDKERSKKEWEETIFKGLNWLGISWDEGPVSSDLKEKIGKNIEYIGSYGPYRQSERTQIYRKYLEKLIKEDKAYYCFCTKEEIDAYREYLFSIGKPPVYSGKCRNLSKDVIEKNLREKKPYIIRFKTPEGLKIQFFDKIRGKIEVESDFLGDFCIAKDLDTPLYNFSCVVDDFEMKITHVIRGEDHISNTPKQILLQKALGFPTPEYAHLPLILGPDRKKLSKRYGGFSLEEYKAQGYLPEAIVNFLAFLGWNPKKKAEIYSLDELISEFSIEGIQKGGAIFNIKKLDWLNGVYIRKKSLDELTQLCLPYLEKSGFIKKNDDSVRMENELLPVSSYITKRGDIISFNDLKKVIGLYQERLKKLSEVIELLDFFFEESITYPKELLKWKDTSDKETYNSLDKAYKILFKIKEEEFNKENIEKSLLKIVNEYPDRGYVLWPLRVALTGKKASAGPFEVAEILGKERVLKRIKEAQKLLL